MKTAIQILNEFMNNLGLERETIPAIYVRDAEIGILDLVHQTKVEERKNFWKDQQEAARKIWHN